MLVHVSGIGAESKWRFGSEAYESVPIPTEFNVSV
jgi:hypothetical protein